MRSSLLAGCSIVALLTLAGCASRSLEELGVAVQAEGNAPKIGAPVDVAPPSPEPTSVLDEVFTARGNGYLAVFLAGPTGREMFAAPFDAQGAPLTAGSIDLGPCNGTIPLGPPMAAACAPSGECVVGCISITQGPLTISTLAADGTVGSVPTAIDDYNGLAIAFDGQAFVFAAASNETTGAFHFEGGAVVEPTPIEITPGGAQVGVACAPDRRCLILAGETAVLQDTDGTIGAPFSETLVSGLTYGAGVYLGYSGFNDQYGLVRIGMDGVVLAPAPLPLTSSPVNPIGAGFDGQFYNLLFQTGGGSMGLARRASDGSDASPAIVDLGALPVDENGTVACIQGQCACAARDPAHGDALSAVLVADDTASLAADAIANIKGGQTFLKLLRVDAGVVVIWAEPFALRARLFSTEGAPLGDAVTLTDAGLIHNVDGDGHTGLIFWADFLGQDATTVVHADGSIGPNRPLTPPATSSADPARFLGTIGNREDGKIRAFRFDAAGQLLDPDPIIIAEVPGLQGATTMLARDAGLFAVAVATLPGGPVRLVRLRPTGETVDPSPPVLKTDVPTGLVCSPDTCVMTAGLGATSAISFRSGDGPLEPRRFESILDLHQFTVAFDDNTFVATYSEAGEIHVVRLDGDAWAAGRARLHGEQLVGAASVAPKELCVVTSPDSATGALHLRVVHDGELPTETSSSGEGGGGSTPTPTPPRAGNGCGCSTPGAADSHPPAAALLFLLLAASVRSRRRG